MPDASAAIARLRGRPALVVGASGFIGARLVDKLSAAGAHVTALLRDPRNAGMFQASDVQIRHARLEEAGGLDLALKGQEIVFNLAYDFKRTPEINIASFRALAEACERAGARRLVHASSIVVYDDWPERDLTEASSSMRPGAGYRHAKMEIERELAHRAEAGTLFSVILQPTIVYGPRSFLWTDQLVERLLTGTVVLPDDGSGVCNAVYVDDVAEAMLLAAVADIENAERFIISAEEPVTWRAFFSAYRDILGTGSIAYEPAESLAARYRGSGGRPSPINATFKRLMQRGTSLARAVAGKERIERLRGLAIGLARHHGPVMHYPSQYDLPVYAGKGRAFIDRAKARLGYAPSTDLSQGMALTADYIRQKYLGAKG